MKGFLLKYSMPRSARLIKTLVRCFKWFKGLFNICFITMIDHLLTCKMASKIDDETKERALFDLLDCSGWSHREVWPPLRQPPPRCAPHLKWRWSELCWCWWRFDHHIHHGCFGEIVIMAASIAYTIIFQWYLIDTIYSYNH